ncbi:MAG: nitrophenyl compound nitroreductase subunit ArsF family protein [Bacteroides sp.]|nr:nitrophenyl compound nitroreductase subunit ArsF family protein [Bacteroides sp.]MCM1085609.1 nitrophenyl compound nitroreductase subunit ArsF family protein [Bacteroides sp.]
MKRLACFLMLALMVVPFVSGFAQQAKVAEKESAPVVEVLYFHGAQRCRTCVALQNAAKEVVDAKFSKELKSGRVAFREIDLSSKEGGKLGDKYEIAWSSLIIVRHEEKKEKVADLTDDGFRYAVNNKDKIQSLIAQKISEFLK